mmetsp:Transcript_27544/g.69449  ORF Transcript_27544/g.69449 Transcript_27544/m.69449 type:complete len:287 (+) Transcript_27544:121-981(+)|eukprot:CAMPEP_0178985430 /NCGR_PEP_ID=MMETSP0795-20121207/2147_1 /TAXON_ID=88552 /ORGANISM="Amoebophrya sp., Strain Ameob2" /LENGTH=286 /DNA_ID=CAMNT_0020676385 /DNA_START=99 /DNA_END=959 /DNA_ORIENTATION=-
MATAEIQRVSFVGFAHMKTHELLFTWNNVHLGRCDDDPRLRVILQLTGATAKKGTTPGQQWKLSWGGTGLGGPRSASFSDEQLPQADDHSQDMVFLSLAFPRGDLLFFVIVRNGAEFGPELYRDHVAYTFLRVLEKRVEAEFTHGGRVRFPIAELAQMRENELSDRFRTQVTELARKYDDPATVDRMAHLQKKTQAVNATMQSNAKALAKHGEDLNRLEEEAAEMEQEAEEYDDAAEEIKEYFWFKKLWITLLVALVVTLVLALTALCLYKCCVRQHRIIDDHDKK